MNEHLIDIIKDSCYSAGCELGSMSRFKDSNKKLEGKINLKNFLSFFRQIRNLGFCLMRSPSQTSKDFDNYEKLLGLH